MDHAAFEMVVRAYSADLYRFAFWLCRNRWQAQDLVQEAFAGAWKGRDSVRDKSAIKAWLFTILRNEHYRVRQRKKLPMEEADLDELTRTEGNNAFEAVELADCLQALPENYREPLMLQVLGGFSCREIGEMMNISEQNVMTRLTRSRQMLQRLAKPKARTGSSADGG